MENIENFKKVLAKSDVAELTKMFNFEELYKLRAASILLSATSYLKGDYTDKELNEISDLGEYIYLKAEEPISQQRTYDAIVNALNNGKKLGELQSMSKWDLLTLVYDY